MVPKVFVAGWISLIGAIMLVIVYAPSTQTSSESAPLSAQDIANLRSQVSIEADKVLNGFDQTCAELHLPSLTPAAPPIKIDLDANEYGTGPGPTIKLTDGGSYELTFLQKDGSLTVYSDDRLFDSLYESYAPYYDKPDKPKWTKDQVIQIGNSFLKGLTEQIKMKLGEGGARFDQKFENSKYHVGEWMLWWPRIDSKGHVFSDDGVTMEIAEGHSPVLIEVKQTTLYFEEKGEPMKMEQALKKIESKIAWKKFWNKVGSILPIHLSEGWLDAKPIGSYLQIVCPGHDRKAPARLAWVFWYHQHPWEMMENPPHPPVHFHYPVSFWVDAYTGALIGGDEVGMDTPD